MSLNKPDNSIINEILNKGYSTPKRKKPTQCLTPSPTSSKKDVQALRRSPRLLSLRSSPPSTLSSSPLSTTGMKYSYLNDSSSDESLESTPCKRQKTSTKVVKTKAMFIGGLTSEGNSPSSDLSSPKSSNSQCDGFAGANRTSPCWRQKFRKALNEIAWEEMNRVRFQARGFYGKKMQTLAPLVAKKLCMNLAPPNGDARDALSSLKASHLIANEKKSVSKTSKNNKKLSREKQGGGKSKMVINKQKINESTFKASYKIKDWKFNIKARTKSPPKQSPQTPKNYKFFSKSKTSPIRKPTSMMIIGNYRVHMPATKFKGSSKPKLNDTANTEKITKRNGNKNVLETLNDSLVEEKMGDDDESIEVQNVMKVPTVTEENKMDTVDKDKNISSSPSSCSSTTIKCYSIFNKERRTSPRNTETKAKNDPFKQTFRQLRSLRNKNSKMEQLVIDAGQKEIGATRCTECGMVYVPCDEVDVNTHVHYHNAVLKTLKFPGWKKERVLQEFHDGRIIHILPDDPKYALIKAQEVQQIVDSELGFTESHSLGKSCLQYFLFVSQEKMIIGCLIAEAITQAYRTIPDGQKSWCCHTEPEKAACGVSRLWTLVHFRKKKIATRLMEALRTHFVYGYVLAKEEIAFSTPTVDGREFAAQYSKTDSFLVYK